MNSKMWQIQKPSFVFVVYILYLFNVYEDIFPATGRRRVLQAAYGAVMAVVAVIQMT